MRITQRQLRQIISEEVQNRLQEADPGIDPDTGLPDPKVSKSEPDSPSSGAIDTLRHKGATAEQIEIFNQNYAAAQKTLDAVLEGKKLIQLGDKGPAVKIVQLLLVTQLDGLIGSAKNAAAINDLRDFANNAVKQLEAVKPILKVDGDYGPTTVKAVRAMQAAMAAENANKRTVGGPSSTDPEKRERLIRPERMGTVDGKVGRQTLRYLITRQRDTAVTSAEDLAESVVRRWNRLAGLIKS